MHLKVSLRKANRLLFGTSESYIRDLRKLGVKIGEGCTIFFPDKCTVDTSAPHLLTIGDYVKITGPSTILTHDYSWSVLKGLNGEILGNQKPVTIGNNVFIGWGATILCGTTIEDNVIIGAHAVVSGHVEHDSVWGGARSADLLLGAISRETHRRSGRGGQGVRPPVSRAFRPRSQGGGNARAILPLG